MRSNSKPNGGQQLVFPSLQLSDILPLGQMTLIDLPALPVGELQFTCGVDTERDSIVIQLINYLSSRFRQVVFRFGYAYSILQMRATYKKAERGA